MLKWLPRSIQQSLVVYLNAKAVKQLGKLSSEGKNNRDIVRCLNTVILAYRLWGYLNPDYEGGRCYYVNTRSMHATDMVYWQLQRQFRRVNLVTWLNAHMTPANMVTVLRGILGTLQASEMLKKEYYRPEPRWFPSFRISPLMQRLRPIPVSLYPYYRMMEDETRVRVEIPFVLKQLTSILILQIEKEKSQRLLWKIH